MASIRSAARTLFRAGAFLARGAVDLVYPPHCLSCGVDLVGEGHAFLCTPCLSRVRPVEDACPRCGTPRGPFGGTGERCGSCRDRRLHFDLAVGAYHYDGPVKRLLHRLKYEGHVVSSRPLAGLAVEAIRKGTFAGEIDRVVPVPMHWKRRMARGYNQSERIASPLAKGLGMPCLSALVKTEVTEPQVDLSREARHKNPAGSFAVRMGRRVAGRNILLVDDVMTTAATVSECARVLKEAGATSVIAFAVARQS